MLRLKDTRHAHTADFLCSAIDIAEYYGFVPLESIRPPKIAVPAAPPAAAQRPESEILFARRDERSLSGAARACARIARALRANGRNGFFAWRLAQAPGGNGHALELHVVGTHSAVAEALLLMIARAVADDAGLSQHALSINSIGSTESSNRFVRDIGTFLRKHIESISPTLRPRAANDPLGTLVQLIERGHPAAPRAPQSMEYLSEDERRRFWELLEYLESANVPYELSPHVLGSRDCWAHSLYELSMTDAETGERIPFAFGGRYDPLASRFAGSHTPAATISIVCESRGKTALKRTSRGLPSMYFAHLGQEARRRSLPVLEQLRKAGIAIHQSLLHERIGDQMAEARALAVPYILIVGYKEAMEGTVLVREVATNSQEAVPAGELTLYLRRRRLGAPRSERGATVG